jgi:hypothetical protein
MTTSRLAALALALVAGCHTEKTSEPAGMSQAKVERQIPQRAWNAVESGRVIGSVVLFVDSNSPDDPARQFFSVRNPFQQELGTLDGFGRAYKFVPHQREAQLVGSGTVLDGARRILGAGIGCELVEVSLESLKTVPAAARKGS